MGTRFSIASDDSDAPGAAERLGDLLYGRFGDVDVDSVEAVRDLRERER